MSEPIDMGKVTPAPWHFDLREGIVGVYDREPPKDVAKGVDGIKCIASKFPVRGKSGRELDDTDIANMRFIALARNAEAAMQQHGIRVIPLMRGKVRRWVVRVAGGADMPLEYSMQHPTRGEFLSPFEAIVDAAEWLMEQDKK